MITNSTWLTWDSTDALLFSEVSADALVSTARFYPILYLSCFCGRRRAEHKSECVQRSRKEMALVLAERSLGVPQLLKYLKMHSIITLGMLNDHSIVNLYAIKVICTTSPADLATVLLNSPSSDIREYLLSISELVRVPFSEVSVRVRLVHDDLCRRLASNTVLALYFTTKEDATGENGAFCAAYLLPESLLRFMASEPSAVLSSGVFGDVRVSLNAENLLE